MIQKHMRSYPDKNSTGPEIKVRVNTENPEPVEIIAQSIIDISAAFEKIKNSKLKQRAIVLLIQDAIGAGNITKKQIEAVLDNIADLKRLYIK